MNFENIYRDRFTDGLMGMTYYSCNFLVSPELSMSAASNSDIMNDTDLFLLGLKSTNTNGNKVTFISPHSDRFSSVNCQWPINN
jgi:hypothetical protein